MWIVADWVARRTNRAITVAVAVVLLMLATVYASAVQTAKLHVTLGHDTRVSSYRMIVELNPEISSWVYALPPLSLMLPAPIRYV